MKKLYIIYLLVFLYSNLYANKSIKDLVNKEYLYEKKNYKSFSNITHNMYMKLKEDKYIDKSKFNYLKKLRIQSFKKIVSLQKVKELINNVDRYEKSLKKISKKNIEFLSITNHRKTEINELNKKIKNLNNSINNKLIKLNLIRK